MTTEGMQTTGAPFMKARLAHHAATAAALARHLLGPTGASAPHGAVAAIGLLATFTVALTFQLSRDITRVAEVLVLLTVLVAWREVLRTPGHRWLVLAIPLFLAWMLLVDAAFHAYPLAADDPVDAMRNYLKQLFFLLAGWWISGRESRARALLFTGMIGASLALLSRGTEANWMQALSTQRTDFGFLNAQHTAIVYGSVLIGLIAYARSFLAVPRPPAARLLLAAIWLLAATGCVIVLAGAQSRQAWLGILVAGLVLAIYGLRAFHLRRPGLRTVAAVSLAAAVLSAVTVGTLSPLRGAMERTWNELPAIAQMLETGSAERSSATIRLNQWRFAVEAIAQRPLTGYGGDATELLLAQADIPEYSRNGFGHVHNSYLELALAYGLPATSVFAGALAVLLWRLRTSHRRGQVSTETAAFGTAWLAFFVVVNVFESYVNYHTGYYLLFIVGSAVYGCTLRGPLSGHRAPR